MIQTASIETPIGTLGIVESDGSIVRLLWSSENKQPGTPVLRQAIDQLRSYFEGELKKFDLPLAPKGSEFQKKVYAAMSAIPYGETRTYGEIAGDLATSAQPVGNACGVNPIPVIIPCHRVLAANGLGGFSGQGGVDMKIALLRQENAIPYLI